MNQQEKPKGIRKLSTFITADALLVVVLLVWAQLWIQPSIGLWYKWYSPDQATKMPPWFDVFNFNVGIGLAWTYFAVFLALLGLAWAGWRSLEKASDKAPALSIGLFAASVAMSIINVSQSVFSVTIKLFKRSTMAIYQPLELSWLPHWFLYFAIGWAIVVVIATGLLAGYAPTNRACEYGYLLWVIGGGLFLLINSCLAF